MKKFMLLLAALTSQAVFAMDYQDESSEQEVYGYPETPPGSPRIATRKRGRTEEPAPIKSEEEAREIKERIEERINRVSPNLLRYFRLRALEAFASQIFEESVSQGRRIVYPQGVRDPLAYKGQINNLEVSFVRTGFNFEDYESDLGDYLRALRIIQEENYQTPQAWGLAPEIPVAN